MIDQPFKFNGISSKEMKVVCEECTSFLRKAALATSDTQDIDSDLNYNFTGYSPVSGSVKLFLLDRNKLDSVKKWLNGVGIIEFGDKISRIAFLDEYTVNREATIYTLNINWTRSPYWYKKDDNYIAVESNIITNEGSTNSYPMIRLEKSSSDTVELTINGVYFKYIFPESESYVEIDCLDCNAFYDEEYRNMNLEIGYNFPRLNPGANNITIHSGSPIVKVKRKDVWL